jgi:hypothetical protein
MITATDAKNKTEQIIKQWFNNDILEIEEEINNAINNGIYEIYKTDLTNSVVDELKKLGYNIKKINGINEIDYKISLE